MPTRVIFRTKPERAAEMIQQAVTDGAPFRWIGWHHHTCLSLLALSFPTLQKVRLGKKHPQLSVPEVRAVLRQLLELQRWDEREILYHSNHRERRNELAKRCLTEPRERQLKAMSSRSKKQTL